MENRIIKIKTNDLFKNHPFLVLKQKGDLIITAGITHNPQFNNSFSFNSDKVITINKDDELIKNYLKSNYKMYLSEIKVFNKNTPYITLGMLQLSLLNRNELNNFSQYKINNYAPI